MKGWLMNSICVCKRVDTSLAMMTTTYKYKYHEYVLKFSFEKPLATKTNEFYTYQFTG